MDQPGIGPGAVVRSLAGRDRGTLYVVSRVVDERRVAVCDGRRRSPERPKVKNRRHLEVQGWVDASLALRLERGERGVDKEVDTALEHWLPVVLEEV